MLYYINDMFCGADGRAKTSLVDLIHAYNLTGSACGVDACLLWLWIVRQKFAALLIFLSEFGVTVYHLSFCDCV